MRTAIVALIFFAAVISGLVTLPKITSGAEQVNFSLSIGQGLRVADYMVTFRGVSPGGAPAYDVLGGGAVLARFPLDPRASVGSYTYGNLTITTNTLSTDGKQARGSVTIQ